MQSSSSRQTIGCIGKCSSGLRCEELDRITDNIHNTLTHPQGRQIFKKYLERYSTEENYDCLVLYETCWKFIDESQKGERDLKSSIKIVMEMVEELDGVSGLDLALLKKMAEAIESSSTSKNEMLGILKETGDYCRDHLRRIHGSFKRDASKPCPLIK